MAPPRKLESLEALKKIFQEIGSRCKNTRFLGFKQSNCGGINSSSKASTNTANKCTSETEVQLWSFWLLNFLFLAVLLYEVNKISGSVLSVQTSDSRSKKYSGRGHNLLRLKILSKSLKHVPGFIERAEELKEKGVDESI